jgi:hypothetical protein
MVSNLTVFNPRMSKIEIVDPLARDQIRKGTLPPLHFVEAFIIALMNANDGTAHFA